MSDETAAVAGWRFLPLLGDEAVALKGAVDILVNRTQEPWSSHLREIASRLSAGLQSIEALPTFVWRVDSDGVIRVGTTGRGTRWVPVEAQALRGLREVLRSLGVEFRDITAPGP